MDNLFGGALTITDNFSNTLGSFTNGLSGARNSFTSFTSKIGEAERANRVSLGNMQKDMERYTNFYTSQGYTLKQAMSKATASLTVETPTTGNKWADAFGKIKQTGTDAFDSIGQKMQNFSNSTLGTITKLTAGFVSVKAALDGVKEGFSTGMEYQNLRLVLDNLYKNPQLGAEKFKMGTDFAANSIWQERDVIKSLSMLKGSGLDDSKNELTQMSDLGSYAKAMGVGDISTATRAYSEMMMGRWNMMTMDLSINREEVEKYAKDHNMKSFDTGTGQITDRSALQTAFSGYIQDRGLTGLTEKMGQTATGKLSTLKDNISKSLADLIGITNTGEVKNGSLFDKFTQGLGKLTTKIKEFSESGNFDKISNGLAQLGGALYDGFSYLTDHPDLVTNLIKLGIGIYALGKVGAVVSFFNSIGTFASFFAEGGALAGLGAALIPIAGTIGIVVAGFLALESALSPNGLLNQGIGWLLGELFGDDIKKGWQEDTAAMADFFEKAKEGWLVLLGLKSPDSLNDTTANNNVDASKLTYYDKNGAVTDNSNVHFYTADDMVKSGQLVKSDNNTSSITNHNSVNVNIAKVEKTADIDDIGTAIADKLDKYSNTRNNLQ